MGNILNRVGFSRLNASEPALDESLEEGGSDSLDTVSNSFIDKEDSVENSRNNLDNVELRDTDPIMNRTPTPIPISIPTLSKIMKESLIETSHVEKYPNYLKSQPKNFNIYTPKETSPLINENDKMFFSNNNLMPSIPEVIIENDNTTNVNK